MSDIYLGTFSRFYPSVFTTYGFKAANKDKDKTDIRIVHSFLSAINNLETNTRWMGTVVGGICKGQA